MQGSGAAARLCACRSDADAADEALSTACTIFIIAYEAMVCQYVKIKLFL